MDYHDYVSKTKKQLIADAIQAWARWIVDDAITGGYVPRNLGYGSGGHAMMHNAGQTKKGSMATAQSLTVEMRIELALWQYKTRFESDNGWLKVQAFFIEQTYGGTQLAKADKLHISPATYRRYLQSVRAHLDTEVFDKLYAVHVKAGL